MKVRISLYVILNLLAFTLKGIINSPRLTNIELSKNLNVLSWCEAEEIIYIQQEACNRFLNTGCCQIFL
jgi:hypothetical protein